MRRWVKLLVAVDVVLLVVGVALWLALRGGDERENAVNQGLRGSTPPAGQVWPGDLATLTDIEPAFPVRGDVAGAPAMLVSTCIDCRSGDVIGSFLGRIEPGDLPDEARALVLVWDGDPAAWSKRYAIDAERFELLHARTPFAVEGIRTRLGIGSVTGEEPSGAAFLYDPKGYWRSTFALGQLDRDDVAHDLRELGRDRPDS